MYVESIENIDIHVYSPFDMYNVENICAQQI